jgi:hypothetical protein
MRHALVSVHIQTLLRGNFKKFLHFIPTITHDHIRSLAYRDLRGEYFTQKLKRV